MADAANPWDARARAYRESPAHRAGADLDALVAWCDPGPGVRALDVATGGGHVADRLRALGCDVTTCDAAAGMRPNVVCPAEELPFDDRSFDVVTCRIAAHHFADPARAVAEMARVSRRAVAVEDTLFRDPRVEEAERLRDSTHVRAYSEPEWREMLAGAGLHVRERAVFEKRHPLEPWLARTGCSGATAARVRGLLAPWIQDGAWHDRKIGFLAVRE
jgi:SAM-dependent methyltransferase